MKNKYRIIDWSEFIWELFFIVAVGYFLILFILYPSSINLILISLGVLALIMVIAYAVYTIKDI